MCFSDARIGQGLVFALVGAAISALIIAGFVYPIWVGHTARPGARALRIGRWMGGLAWAISFYASLAARDFRRVDFDILLPWAVILTLAALILAPLVSAGMRGPRLKPPRVHAGGSTCPNTGCLHVNRAGARFCARCGTLLRSQYGATADQRQRREPATAAGGGDGHGPTGRRRSQDGVAARKTGRRLRREKR